MPFLWNSLSARILARKDDEILSGNKKGGPRAAPSQISRELLRDSALLLFFGRLLCGWGSRGLCRRRRCLRSARHAVLEAADTLAKSLHDFRDSLTAKENQYNGQNHKPMKNAKFTHEPPPRAPLGGALLKPYRRQPCAASLCRFLQLQDNTLFPYPACHMFAVEVFEQGDGVLPRDPRQFLERKHGNPVALCFLVSRKLLLQLSKGLAVKNQLWRHAHKVFISQENLQELLCALGFDRKFCQHLFHRWHRQARGAKRRFNLFFGLDFFGEQGDY